MMPLTRYERRQLLPKSFQNILLRSFSNSVQGWQLIALGLTFVAALLCLAQGRSRKPASRIANYGPLAAVIAAGLMLVVWASDPASWAYELNYRFWVVPISMVVMLVCAFDAWRTRTDRTMMLQQRQPVVIAVGAVFLIVLSIQSFVWNQLTNRLLAETKDGGCIPHVNLGWTYQTPFEHWSLASYMIVLQGQTPRTLILDRNGCNAYDLDGTVHIIWLTRHSGEGWFDLDKVPANILPP
jgi:hypothetical protein